MDKIYAERLLKVGEPEAQIPAGTNIRLRFLKDDFMIIKPHFKAHIQNTGVPLAPFNQEESIEGNFETTTNSNIQNAEGIFSTDDTLTLNIKEIEEYEVTVDEEIPEDQASQVSNVLQQKTLELPNTTPGESGNLITQSDNGKDDQVLEVWTYSVEGPITITTVEERAKWQKMNAQQIVADLSYDWKQVQKEFAKANPAAGNSLAAWIKKSIIDYGWREGQTPPDLLKTTVDYATDGLPIIEAFQSKDAYAIANQQLGLKEFQSFYLKGKITGNIELKTIYYGSAEVVYNKMHVDQLNRKQLIADLYLASGHITYYQNALAEKNTGEAFVSLVRSAQEVLFYDQLTEVDGKLGPNTMKALERWKTRYSQFGNDVYIQRITRRLAQKKIPNDALIKQNEIKQSERRKQEIKSIQTGGDVKGTIGSYYQGQADLKMQLNGIANTNVDETSVSLAKTYTDDQLIDQLKADFPRDPAKDGTYFGGPDKTDTYMGHTVVVKKAPTENEAILKAYNNLKQEGVELANTPIIESQPASNYEYMRQRLNEDVQVMLILLSGSSEGGVAVSTFAQTEALAKSLLTTTEFGFFQFWRATVDRFFLKNITSSTRPKGNTDASAIYTDDKAADFQVDLNKLMNWYVMGGGTQVAYTYEQAVDILMQGGDIINNDLITALQLQQTDPRTTAATHFQSSSDRYKKYKSLDISVSGTLMPVPATLETETGAFKRENYNPASGASTPTVFPLDLILEKNGDQNYVLHLMGGGEGGDHPQPSGSSLVECMRKLAEGHVLPAGTIYYFDPEDTRPASEKWKYSQVVTDDMAASSVWMWVSIGLAVLAAIPSGGTSLMIIGAGIAGAVSIGLQMYERNEVGELKGVDAVLDVANIVLCLLPVVGQLGEAGVFTRLASEAETGVEASEAAQLAKANFISQFKPVSITMNIGIMTANGISMSQGIIDSLAAIDKRTDLKKDQKDALRQQIMTEGMLLGLFIVTCIAMEAFSAMPGKKNMYALGQEIMDEEGAIFRIIKGENEGEYMRYYLNSGDKVPMSANDAFFPGKTIASGKSGIASMRPSEIITDAEGNYYRKYTDTGQIVSVSADEITASGEELVSPGSYEVYEENGVSRRRSAGSSEPGNVISQATYEESVVASMNQQEAAAALSRENNAGLNLTKQLGKLVAAYAIGTIIGELDPDAKGKGTVLLAGALFVTFNANAPEFLRAAIDRNMNIANEELMVQLKERMKLMDEFQPHLDNYYQKGGVGDPFENIKLVDENGNRISLEDYIAKQRVVIEAEQAANAKIQKYPNGSGAGLKGKGDWSFKPEKDVDWRGNGATYEDALDEAFRRIGISKSQFTITKVAKNKLGKSIPVEWRGPNGEDVNMDIPEWNNIKPGGELGEGPYEPHIGYTYGKKQSRVRGHIFVDDVPATR